MDFDLAKYFSAETFEKILRIAIILVVGLVIIYIVTLLVKKLLPKNLSQQRRMIINRFVQYSGVIILFFIIVSELTIDLTAIFGAAGIIGIVVGVASQTSIGNIVSGFFLVSEKSFELGDLIRIGDKSGTVYSIDLLSIKIKTFDNLLLRIPNQTVISSEVINITRFPIRRFDLDLSVAYKEDLGKVKEIIDRVVKNNPLCLDEPEPIVIFKTFGDSGINIMLGVWFEKNNFIKVRNSVFQEIKAAFDAEGIEIPFPHISIYTGETTKPFPVVDKSKNTNLD
ncbi:MAG: mechanosensitive ion channel family protein [Prolixibacteraceae bacterium]|nr:mechanosensitive ion channel family protein [Prolixibacteraceae bacterium]